MSDYETANEENTIEIIDKELNETYFHSEHIPTSYDLLSVLQTYNYGLLFAQPQSGKSETTLFVAFSMLDQGLVDRVIICSAVADIEKKTEWIDEINKSTHEYLTKYSKYSKIIYEDAMINGQIDCNLLGRLIQDRDIRIGRMIEKWNAKVIDGNEEVLEKNAGIIQVRWGNDFPKIKSIPKRTMLLVDESHFGAQYNCKRIVAPMQSHGLDLGDEDLCSKLEKKKIYLASVSATPIAEILRNHKNKTLQECTIKPQYPASYIGIRWFLDNNKIKKSFPLSSENEERFKEIIDKYDIGYIPVRDGNKKFLKEFCLKYDFDYKIYDSLSVERIHKNKRRPDDFRLNDFHKKPLKKTIVNILPSGMLTLGTKMPKEYIVCCFENKENSTKTDTIIQSLLGRCCGYKNNKNIDIYIPSRYIPELRKYCDMFITDDIVIGNSTGTTKTTMRSKFINISGVKYVSNVPINFNTNNLKEIKKLVEDKYEIFNDLSNPLFKSYESFINNFSEATHNRDISGGQYSNYIKPLMDSMRDNKNYFQYHGLGSNPTDDELNKLFIYNYDKESGLKFKELYPDSIIYDEGCVIVTFRQVAENEQIQEKSQLLDVSAYESPDKRRKIKQIDTDKQVKQIKTDTKIDSDKPVKNDSTNMCVKIDEKLIERYGCLICTKCKKTYKRTKQGKIGKPCLEHIKICHK